VHISWRGVDLSGCRVGLSWLLPLTTQRDGQDEPTWCGDRRMALEELSR
jgi:hypothetical protein